MLGYRVPQWNNPKTRLVQCTAWCQLGYPVGKMGRIKNKPFFECREEQLRKCANIIMMMLASSILVSQQTLFQFGRACCWLTIKPHLWVKPVRYNGGYAAHPFWNKTRGMMVVQKSLLLLANFHLVLASGNVDQVFLPHEEAELLEPWWITTESQLRAKE